MGIYMYGIRKLKKAQRVMREDGAYCTVTHCLSYVSKPYWGFDGAPSDRYSRLAMGRIERAYGDNFKGVVLFGASILLWDGSPVWFDGGDLPPRTVKWGIATDLKEVSAKSEDDHLATLSHARLPTMSVKVDNRTYRLDGEIMVQDHRRYVVASREVYATRHADGSVRLRGGHETVILPALMSDAEVLANFRAYREVAQDWLTERTPVPPPPAPVAPLPPPAPTHEECLRAAGWI